MSKKNKKVRVVPEQDQRICGSICFCQLTMIFSCVSIVYLSVAIYSPSMKAFKSGFEPEPVLCQTIGMFMPDVNAFCEWASCGEWCLTKTSGFCPQIQATARRNGTDIQFNNCTRINTTQCPLVDVSKYKVFNCNNGTICSNLKGVFECVHGHCSNISEFLDCHHKADGSRIDPEKDNRKMHGSFECYGPKCRNITKKFKCDRYCPKITTTSINVFIMHDNSITAADCETGIAFNEARGTDPRVEIEPINFWHETDGMLLANCLSLERDPLNIDKFNASDCLNGTIVDSNIIPQPFMNFSQFWKIYEESGVVLDPHQRFLPRQSNLTIINSTKLYINLEGCVNTLRGECKDFVENYGSFGDNHTAQSRYKCFYNKNDHTFVIARFDLDLTYRQFLVALILPTVLFVISSITLCIITKSVKVGDDSKMRCVSCCCGTSFDDEECNYHSNTKSKSRYIDLPAGEQTEQIQQQSDQMNSHEMVGSTKSLIPLDQFEETITEKSLLNDNGSTKSNFESNEEKPLQLIKI